MKVMNLKSIGSAYKSGTRMPGWGIIVLEDGTEIYRPESENSFAAMCEYAKSKGHSTKEVMDKWRTGC